MKASRLEEVLDECLSAYVDGRRSIEESLSLYPDVRVQLEPLLRTAVELAEDLGGPSPTLHLQERGREEFLNHASVRRRARELTQDMNLSRRIAQANRGRRKLPFIIAIFALTSAAVAATVIAFDSSPSDPGLQAGIVPSPVSPAISDLRQTQELLRDQLTNQALGEQEVSPEFFRELAERTRELDAQIGEFDALDERSRRELQRAIGYQARLLRKMVNSQPPAEVAPAAYQALDLTEQLADEWGVDLPETPASTVGVSSPAPTEEPGGGPLPSAEASASPSPTTPPESEQTPVPSPAPAIP